MPTLDFYRSKKNSGMTIGQHHKMDSDAVMLHTWDNDIASCVGYFFDMYHDPNPKCIRGLDEPWKYMDLIPIDIKYIQHTQQTYDKDHVTFHIQFKPGQQCTVPYYHKYEDMYDIEWPMGLYCFIQNEAGRWDRWLVVDKANTEMKQFPTYEILKCDYTFQYIIDHTRYEVAGVLRSQNSYNSGIWNDYRVTAVEDQQKFVVPLNRETEKIYYTENGKNLRMIIDAKVKTEPRTYIVSKINRLSPNGLVRVTLAQKLFDPHSDFIELDENGNVIGMWADYYDSITPPKDPIELPSSTHAVITYSGTKPEIKIGGSYKTFTVKFYDANDGEIPYQTGSWKFTINGEDATGLLAIKNPEENQIKVKFAGDDSYIGSVLTIGYETAGGLKTAIMVDLVGI